MGCKPTVQAKKPDEDTAFQRRFAPGKRPEDLTLIADLKGTPGRPEELAGFADGEDNMVGAVNNKKEADGWISNRWRPIKVLGIGGFGTVTLVKNDHGEVAAVKTIEFAPNHPNIGAALQLLKREMRVLRMASHPNIVKYYKSTRTKSSVHMFMEYCPGGSIKAAYTANGPIPLETAKRYLSDALLGLAFLHSNNVIHRDIKCDNILLSAGNVAKLADFGASVDLGDLSQCTRIGTFFWMAPEVLTGEGHRWEADIWSVGCTLMEMLTARRPFSWCCVVQTQLVSTLTDIHGLHPPLPSSITDEQCIHFLQLCLVKARTLRPPVPMLQQHRFLKQAEGCLHDIE